MSRRKKDKNLVVGVLMVCAVIVVAVGAYVKFAPADKIHITDEVIEQTAGGVTVLVPRFEEDGLVFETTEVDVPKDQDPRIFALNLYLRKVAAVPKEVAALTCTVFDTVATVDFNAAFDRSYGTEDEMIVINGILRVLGQFKEIASVMITVEGNVIESIGNLDLTESHRVIRPDPGD